MSLALILVLAASASPTSDSLFDFVGQPDCVELSYADGRTQLTNRCPHPLLLDQSVHLPSESRAPIVLPQAQVRIRDLSAFTVGLDGRLYRIVATLAEPEGSPTGAPQATPAPASAE